MSALHFEEGDELIPLIYSGLMEQNSWESFVRAYRHRLGGRAASITLRSPDLGAPRLQVFDGDAGNLQAYIDRYHKLNPFESYPIEAGAVLCYEDIVGRDEFESSEFYRQYLQPADLVYGLRFCFAEPSGLRGIVQTSRSSEQGNFDESDKEFCRQLIPHLENALAIYARMKSSEVERDLYENSIEKLGVGVVILDGDKQVLRTNTVAEELLAESSGLVLRQQSIAHRDRSVDRRLQQMIEDIIAFRDGDQFGNHDRIIRMSEAEAGFGVLLRPITKHNGYEGRTCPSVGVFISNPKNAPVCHQTAISELFDLTEAEAVLAMQLAEGLTLKEAAIKLHISEHTARNHCKHVLAKTGLSRQTDLVRLILKSVAALG